MNPMYEPLPVIELKKQNEPASINPIFKHATNGTDVSFKTLVSIEYTDLELITHFDCKDNTYTEYNSMTQHNDPLYNQEVFEIFISAGAEDSKRYLEVEINPNGAMWIGYIDNPTLGEQMQTLDYQLEPKDAHIRFEANKNEGTWSGFIAIPWRLISKVLSNDYRINFYRIRRNNRPENKDWVCDENNCDFVCWSPTLSGNSPAFHRPKMFGHLKVNRF